MDEIGIRLRVATFGDVAALAQLHADNWRRHYRGAYSDAYLDGDLLADRLEVWSNRLRRVEPSSITLLAEGEDHIVGFVHCILDKDPLWGALVDNLHVTHALERRGIGTRLLASVAGSVVERRTASGLYLWVMEQNVAAQRFYSARGGARVESAAVEAPGGNPERLSGAPVKFRIAWSDPRVLADAWRTAG